MYDYLNILQCMSVLRILYFFFEGSRLGRSKVALGLCLVLDLDFFLNKMIGNAFVCLLLKKLAKTIFWVGLANCLQVWYVHIV